MPRSSRSSGGSRPAARPAPAQRAAPAPAPAQRAAAPVAAQQTPANSHVPATIPQQQGPGLMGQIAANAASMTIASTAARGISHAMGWGYSAPPAAAAEAGAPQTVQDPSANGLQQSYGQPMQQQQGGAAAQCEYLAKDFRECLSATKGDPSPCQYYLDQFKACQAAAAPY